MKKKKERKKGFNYESHISLIALLTYLVREKREIMTYKSKGLQEMFDVIKFFLSPRSIFADYMYF